MTHHVRSEPSLSFLAEDAVYEAECLIQRVLEELSDPTIGGGTTCTPAVLLERTKACLDVIDSATANFSLYNNDSSGTLINAHQCIQC